ncbi:fucolectin-7 [Biomphalaria glabrata]|uniref:Fucolectin-1-like n=1 Tax=Biomphalaria glabrata TaxID=6526 RepID=A0A9W3ATD2_BIOGL|nr:fucolectin-1-like [Biomphalaria glabrata]KAI8762180.1 fucolectin-7-like [Biomphalaria glabrata]
MPAMFTLVVYNLMVTAATLGLYNAARFKSATQSTSWLPFYASLAVDGDSDPDATHGHCQHTQQELRPWWMVDLRGQFVVEQIKITNRQDGPSIVPLRLSNFDIDVFEQDPSKLANFVDISGQVCYHQTASPGAGTFLYNCTSPIVGRYVRLIMRLASIEHLHVCEIEVLVSNSSFEEVYFNRLGDTKLTNEPIITLIVSDLNNCLQECLQRRSTHYCTAFNWVTSTRSCQLLSVNPFLDLTVNLTSAIGTHFYSEYGFTL